ncbi:hypothetical protein BGZ65_011985 [Modicella reniformis]|uniref:Uncharacterized protein n=1 Tax=Modicella reniformis TaxID=1440133 RepID=A0A9P6MJQ8_9FUNG|nr:hypothetical protein BGZ65_011985 [Modicella reniformis]
MSNVKNPSLRKQSPSPPWQSESSKFQSHPIEDGMLQEQEQPQKQQTKSSHASPIMRLPVDILLYIASPRFLSLNDIVQWRATASIFYQSISLPHATMILQVAHLFQIRPRRGHREQDLPSPTSASSQQQQHRRFPPAPPPQNIHSLFKDRQLQGLLARLTRLLVHPEFQPRLMRSSYSFRIRLGMSYSLDTLRHTREHPPQHRSLHDHDAEQHVKRTKRIRRDLQDYPIFVTGNPPDLVRLAIEFGHIPFVDHLLQRGFRPRDLPEYFSSLPFLSADDPTQQSSLDVQNDVEGLVGRKQTDTVDSKERAEHRNKSASFLKRSLELTQIWECMRTANQDLMDACSRADLDGVLKVLDATLILPRLTLDIPDTTQSGPEGQKPVDKGKQRHVSYEAPRQCDSTDTGSVALALDDELSWEATDTGVGSSSTRQRSISQRRERAATAEQVYSSPMVISSEEPSSAAPTVVPRSTIFTTRRRVNSDVSQTQSPSSTMPSPSVFDTEEPYETHSHTPWVDGRALTSALLAVCFRRDGNESEETAALEESRAVPIVNEILKYDCMLTAQALGQAVQAVAYSRPLGSLKRAFDQRQQRRQWWRRLDRTSSSTSSRPESASQNTSTSGTPQSTVEIGVMDLLMERIGPREWLKLIKYYLQRREFEDLAVLLELCPFKGPQIETKDRGQDNEPYYSPTSPRDPINQQDYYRQQARELICREAGICGVGTRLGHFNGRGIGQSSYNVAATLHSSSRMLFTGSGTRFNNTFMLPRGGFRGIGGNTSGHSSSVGNSSAQSGDSGNSSFNATEEGEEEEDYQRTSGHDVGPPLDLHEALYLNRRDQRRRPENIEESEGEGENIDMEQESIEVQDTSLAFGGMVSNTTSSSRPGPGIVGIAIQVQAPDHILRALLKMGFRFFSICDLSVSDTRHPLALQFRQQERMNRLLIDFCMAPISPGTIRPLPGAGSATGHSKGKQKKGLNRDKYRYDAAEQEHYAQAVERFLYPSASNPARGSASISALPSQTMSNSVRGGTDQRSSVIIDATTISENPTMGLGFTSIATQASSSALTPSDRLQFILPPVRLGESFESLTAATEFPEQGTGSSSPVQGTFSQPRYSNNGQARSMPLPIRTSMIEARRVDGSSLLASLVVPELHGEQGGSNQDDSGGISAYQRMVNETTKRRVREFLASEYIDLTTVGICLHQACYHKKEPLLRVLLEHRLLIAQDALAGAVQVAASVGWKRGLEILLIQLNRSSSNVTTVGHDSISGNENSSSNGAGIGVGVGVGVGGGPSIRQDRPRSFHITNRASSDFSRSTPFFAPGQSSPPPPLGPPLIGPFIPTARSSSLKTRLTMILPKLSGSSPSSSKRFRRKQKAKQQEQQQEQQQLPQQGRSGEHLTPLVIPKDSQRRKSSPPVLMLSTSMLWVVPNAMLQRKNRNAVLALMAATTGNDSGLVRWLVECFADIKLAHIMQALMIACDRGFIKVVKVLVGGSTIDKAAMKSTNGNSPRLLLRRWLEFQHRRIMEHALFTQESTSGSTSALSVKTATATAPAKAAENESMDAGDSSQQRFDSFPFIFLMESSPIFRHYFQILNTLSSCQFMTLQRSHAHSRSPQETKQELIRILLQPILEIFGPISFRKTLDRIPRDSWWPLDYDVRLMADQEARKSMVAIATAMNRAKKQQDQIKLTQADAVHVIHVQSAKGKWHKLVGQRFRQWIKGKKATKAHAPSGSEGKTPLADTASTKPFFRRLCFGHAATNA